MKKIIVLTSAILLAVLNLMAQSSGYYTIPEDKSVVSGKLANGMTYFIKKILNPAGKGEFLLFTMLEPSKKRITKMVLPIFLNIWLSMVLKTSSRKDDARLSQ